MATARGGRQERVWTRTGGGGAAREERGSVPRERLDARRRGLLALRTHECDQPVVEVARGIVAHDLQGMGERGDLHEARDVAARPHVELDVGYAHPEDIVEVLLEARTFLDHLRSPLPEGDDHVDALLAAHALHAEHLGDVDDADADRGNDFVRGGAGDDGVIDLSGKDTIYGDSGDDILATFGTGQTPDAPDTIDGGAGDDALFGDNADVMTGGTGTDVFSIIKPANSPSEEVIITDFSTTDDTLGLFVPDGNSDTETVDLRYDPSENLVRAFWRGDEVAVLNGLTSADIPNVQVAVFDAQDLANGSF